jgi:hypothetical protein
MKAKTSTFDAGRGLSCQERHILILIRDLSLEIQEAFENGTEWSHYAWGHGHGDDASVKWQPGKWRASQPQLGPWTRAESAAVSRTLKRLCQRGLLERWNMCSGNSARTTDVAMTPTGWDVAQRLTKRSDTNC